MKKILFAAWFEDYKETRRAKRWFNREGGGPNGDSLEEDGVWYWPDGEDPISLLPRPAAIKVRESLAGDHCVIQL